MTSSDPITVAIERTGPSEVTAWPGALPPVKSSSQAGAMADARKALNDAGFEGRRIEFGIVER
jgi:hypothetical protein